MRIEEQLERLAGLDTCAVSDALDALTITGAVSGIRRRTSIQRICGRVRTIKLGEMPQGDGPKVHLGAATIVSSGEHDVIVVEQRTGIDAAGWGGVLSNAAKTRSIRGVIVEGPARDVDECDDIGFAVFSRSTTARTARGRIVQHAMDSTVTVGDVSVAAGDLVIADGSGVVFIPAAEAARVLAIAERISNKEQLMTRDVREGEPVTEIMGRSYESMLDDMETEQS